MRRPVLALGWAGFAVFVVGSGLSSGPVWGAVDHSRQLDHIRTQTTAVERELIQALESQKSAKDRMNKLQSLLGLLKKEKEIGDARMRQLERFILDLESRKKELRAKITSRQSAVWSLLVKLRAAIEKSPDPFRGVLEERDEAPRREALNLLVRRGIREAETLKADLADVDVLEIRIQEEKEQLASLFLELKEREDLLRFHRQLHAEQLREKVQDRADRLRKYQSLKEKERKVESLIQQFNARLEFNEIAQAESRAERAMNEGVFAAQRGKLPWPVIGKVTTFFGRTFDPETKLNVFRKGVEIRAAPNRPVTAVFPGRVVFAGQLPGYGNVNIVDHGQNYFSLVAKLGKLVKKVGDPVSMGETVGHADDAGTPVYFEIRAKNAPVNPLQWVGN